MFRAFRGVSPLHDYPRERLLFAGKVFIDDAFRGRSGPLAQLVEQLTFNQ